MDTKKLLAISKKARQERKQEKEKRRQEKLQAVENEEEIEVDMDNGIITSKKGETITFKKLPPFMLEILENGGLIEYLKQKRQ